MGLLVELAGQVHVPAPKLAPVCAQEVQVVVVGLHSAQRGSQAEHWYTEAISSRRKPELQLHSVGLLVESAGHEHTFPLKFAPVWKQEMQVVSEPLQLPQGKVQGVH